MGQDVGVADEHLVVREGPMPLSAARVVVVDEGHGVLRQPTNEPRRPPVLVPEPPELREPAGLLQDALGGEVEGRGPLLSAVHPVHQLLPVRILVVTEPMLVVGHVLPELAHGPGRVALLAVLAYCS